jgi:hypothetical protein
MLSHPASYAPSNRFKSTSAISPRCGRGFCRQMVLALCPMKRLSIFEGVVRSEDAHTNLLRNLMLADVEYGKAVCSLLTPKGLDLSCDQLADIGTQVSLRTAEVTHGRADLLIKTRAAVLLVEVKTDLYCSLTDYQHFGLDDSGNPKIKGYLQYLEEKRLGGVKVGLCVLAPRQWVYRGETAAYLKQLMIPAHVVTWETLCARTMNTQFTDIVNEFACFLEGDFMSISFGAEESSFVTSDVGLQVLGSASLKLHELVKQAAKELKVLLNTASDRSYEVKDLWGDAKEHGATVYHGGKPRLWFGTWDSAGWPLVVGFQEKPIRCQLNVSRATPRCHMSSRR